MSTRLAANTIATGTEGPDRKPRIMVLEDEPAMQRLLKMILEDVGCEVLIFDDGKQVLEWLTKHDCELIIQDLRMPKMDGLLFLKTLRERHPSVLSIVVTAFSNWETSVEAMRLGAYTYMPKPFDTEEMRQVVARALERKRISMRAAGADILPFLDLVGNSSVLNAVSLLIKRIAPTDSTVLIAGESGTGKELVARAIHYYSLRAKGPFVPVNCGAFTETLLESELFGHVRGAFTHAIADRRGLFDASNTGTLFLDEIGEMSLLMQVKLLRVLETRSYKPVGGSREVRSDVRIIAATNRHLSHMVSEGLFREDLFHRLNVIPIGVPALRERKEDIPLLAGHFLARYAQRVDKPIAGIDEGALRCLVEYVWPGNVRELENTIERAVALCDATRIMEAHIMGPMNPDLPSATARSLAAPMQSAAAFSSMPTAGRGWPFVSAPRVASAANTLPLPHPPGHVAPLPPEGMDLERYLLEQEHAYIVQALERTDWNLTEAAKLLGMTFRSIRYRVSKLGIEKPPR